ncbi:hypothetical protein [Streptomyces boninensis]|uniref:hypothetical protein n=1 Tax=Streptomyces boninensis TaxID=2039455 RepID=UPI003B215187
MPAFPEKSQSADPQEPDTFDDSLDLDAEAGRERPFEVPEADSAEQHTDLQQRGDSPAAERGDQANPADVAEQARVVAMNEDEYRDSGGSGGEGDAE